MEESRILEGLNEGQKKAVLGVEGTYQVNAVAGSGKTHTLVRRLDYMINELGISPSSIMVTTFTKKASEEMTDRLKKVVGSQKILPLTIGTTHSICYRILKKEYQLMNHPLKNSFGDLLVGSKQKIVCEKIVGELLKDFSVPTSVKQELKNLPIKAVISVLGGFKDSCQDNIRHYLRTSTSMPSFRMEAIALINEEYEAYKKENRLLDLSDLLCNFNQLLDSNKEIREKYQKLYKYILVDESQDNNAIQYEIVRKLAYPENNIFFVGDDDQCVLEGSMVSTDWGDVPIENIKQGDFVASARGNGEISYEKVLSVSKSERKCILTIKTKLGKTFKCTPEHIMFADDTIEGKSLDNEWIVYLMYSEEFGFRIGQTGVGIHQRSMNQKADKVWIVKKCYTLGEALYWETFYSLKYQITTNTYENTRIGKELQEKIFKEYGKNGFTMLEDRGMSFNHPNHHSQTTKNATRLNVNVILGGTKGHQVVLETTNKEISDCLEKAGIPLTDASNNGKRFRPFRRNYKEILDYVRIIINACTESNIPYEIKLKASILKGGYRLTQIPASQLVVGSKITTVENEEILLDEIISIEKESGQFTVYDLNVENNHNFIANEVISHNCIYSFRGSRPDQFINLKEYYPRTQPIHINTNYRSDKRIIDCANKLITHNSFRVDKLSNTHKYFENISNPVVLRDYDSDLDQGEGVCMEIQRLVNDMGYKYSDIYVLYRVNNCSMALEECFLRNEIPYELIGSMSFFERKEIKDILAYLSLVIDEDNNMSFYRIYNTPTRYLGKAFLSKLVTEEERTGLSYMSIIRKGNVNLKPYEYRATQEIISLIDSMRQIYNEKGLIACIDYLLNDGGYIEYLTKEDEDEEDNSRVANVETFKGSIGTFNSIHAVLAYIKSLTDNANKLDSKSDTVKCMSIHKSKGLESPVVFMISSSEGIIPHRNILAVEDEEKRKKQIEEERRLMYVALTRAEQRFYGSSIKWDGMYSYKPSRFLRELADDTTKYINRKN